MRRLLGSVYFQPLYNDDPVPGEQEALAELVAYLGEVAANVRAQSEMLKRLETGEIWDSVARDEFGKKQEALPPRLDMVADRYEKVMLQLQSWSEALSNIQPDLDQACGEARTAHESSLEARQEEQAAEQAQDEAARAAAEARGAELWEWFEECRARAERAVEAHGEVAEQIEKGIREAIEDGLTNEWWESALDTLGDWMGTVSSFLGVASLAFPILAPFAAGTNLISLATRWGIEGEEPDQWTWDVWLGVASLGVGRAVVGPGGQIARSLSRTSRNIRGQEVELGKLRAPSMQRITKRRKETDEEFEQRRARMLEKWRVFKSRQSDITLHIANLQRERMNRMLRQVRAEQRQFWLGWRSGRNWRFDPTSSWQTWRANDPEWARCLALVEQWANIAGTTADVKGVYETVDSVYDPYRPEPPPPPRMPDPRPGPSPTPRPTPSATPRPTTSR